MAKITDRTVVGFDLGHGESAVSAVATGSDTAPSVLDLRGAAGRQHVTAVAVHPEHGVLVGEAAMATAGVEKPIYLAFKSRHFDREEVRRPVGLFVRKVREDLEQAAAIPRPGNALWVFGAPSSWPAPVRAKYADLLRTTGIKDVEVVPESRAAMLYARDSGDVTIDRSALAGTVLVVDVGSSTTDFTAVRGMKAQESPLGRELGASLIDKTIQRGVISRHEQRELLESLLDDNGDERLRMELSCRKAKEKFFRLDPTLTTADAGLSADELYVLRIPGRPTIWVPIEIARPTMDEVLGSPQPVLDGRTWKEAFHDDLATAATQLVGGTPDVVLLTGGASRMHFVLESAQELFTGRSGRSRVLLGAEPEVAIARGLAIAGRMSTRTTGFRDDVKRFLAGTTVSSLVSAELPALAERIGAAAADGITERHVIPAFQRWRAGDIRTLNDIARDVAKAVSAELTDPDNARMAAAMTEWQTGIRTQLAELTRPLAQRWHLEPNAMVLPPITIGDGRWQVGMDNSSAVTGVLSAMAMAINVVVATVISTVLLGQGVALIATTGPLAPILLAVGLIVAGAVGSEAMMQKALEVELPKAVRWTVREGYLTRKLRADAHTKEKALAHDLAEQLVKNGGEQMVRQISTLIVVELEEVAKEAELLIA